MVCIAGYFLYHATFDCFRNINNTPHVHLSFDIYYVYNYDTGKTVGG